MSNKQTCKDCLFFRAEPLNPKSGTCRGNFPMAVPMQGPAGIGFAGYWPPTAPDEWCGKWEAAPEAIKLND